MTCNALYYLSTAMQSLSLNEAKRYNRCGLAISESVGDMSTVFWSTALHGDCR